LAGGGTDIAPYFENHTGAVICTAIDRYAYVSLKPTPEKIFRVHSQDYNLQQIFQKISDLKYDGKLDLIKAGFRTLGFGEQGFDITLHADVPPGSGLGSSSAVAVALVGGLFQFANRSLSSYEVADIAVKIERVELGLHGGIQDQYASAFGGFNFIEFKKDSVIVNPLRLKPQITCELLASMLLLDTGKTRLSGDILSREIEGYKRKESNIVENLENIKKLAYEMKDSLVKGDLNTVSQILHQSWIYKKSLDESISNPIIDDLYDTARREGALGGKLLGAGGGGHLLLICDPDKKDAIAKEMTKKGCKIVNFNFDTEGLQTWRLHENKVVV
jgi:D-glycero-alpha-D-manno-heptose-7-phosphate kinase